MILLVRKKIRWINFLHGIEELKAFEDSYFPDTQILIGDLSMFSKSMLNRLLKFLEENPKVDCYSSRDLTDPVLLSRFVHVDKEPLSLGRNQDTKEFLESSRDSAAVVTFLPHFTPEFKLRAVNGNNFIINMFNNLS